MRSVDTSMSRVATGTRKSVALPAAQLPAFAAALGSVGGVDEGHGHAISLRPAGTRFNHHVKEPLTKLAVGTAPIASAFTNLLYTQILKDQYGVSWYPFTQFSRCFFAKRSTAVRVFTTQPFQSTSHGAGARPPGP